MNRNKKPEIDFVVLWVNGNDPQREKLLKKYKKDYRYSRCRDRDLGLFKFFFRSIEKNAPWYRKLHLILTGSAPDWLNLDHPKLNIIRDHEIFENKGDLPTFNSNAVQSNLENINGLTEKFVLFDDDFYIIKPTMPSRFFRKGLPTDYVSLLHHRQISERSGVWEKTVYNSFNRVEAKYGLNGLKLIKYPIFSRCYSKRHNQENWKMLKELIKQNKLRVGKFSLMNVLHRPQALRKSFMVRARREFNNDFIRTSSHKFRQPDDMVWSVFRYWHILNNRFYPFYDDNEDAFLYLLSYDKLEAMFMKEFGGRYPRFLCINDHYSGDDEQEILKMKRWTHKKLREFFPDKCQYER